MDLLTINEIATMLKTSEGVAKQIMGDTPYLHLGSGKGKGRRYRRSDVLAEILGHANLTMILKHYQHTIREQKRTAMNAITMPPDSPAWVKRGDQGPKKGAKVTHEEKNVLQ